MAVAFEVPERVFFLSVFASGHFCIQSLLLQNAKTRKHLLEAERKKCSDFWARLENCDNLIQSYVCRSKSFVSLPEAEYKLSF